MRCDQRTPIELRRQYGNCLTRSLRRLTQSWLNSPNVLDRASTPQAVYHKTLEALDVELDAELKRFGLELDLT